MLALIIPHLGPASSNGWLFSYGPGLALNQQWLQKRYNSAIEGIVVTENGWGNASSSEAEDVYDDAFGPLCFAVIGTVCVV